MSALGEYVHARKANYARFGISRSGGSGRDYGSFLDISEIHRMQESSLSSGSAQRASDLEKKMNEILNSIEPPDKATEKKTTLADNNYREDFFNNFIQNFGSVAQGKALSAFKKTVRGALSGDAISQNNNSSSIIGNTLNYFNELLKDNVKTNYRLASHLEEYCLNALKEITDSTKLQQLVNKNISLEEIQVWADELVVILSDIRNRLRQIGKNIGKKDGKEYNFRLTSEMQFLEDSFGDSLISQIAEATYFLRKLRPSLSAQALGQAGEAMGMTLGELAIPKIKGTIGNMFSEIEHTGSKNYGNFTINISAKVASKAAAFKKSLSNSKVGIKSSSSSEFATFTIEGRQQRVDFIAHYKDGNTGVSQIEGFSVKNKMNLNSSGAAGKIHIYDESPLWNVFGRITNGIDLANHYMNLASVTVYHGNFAPKMGLDGVGNPASAAYIAKRAYLTCALQGSTADANAASVNYLMIFERSAASGKFVRIISIADILNKLFSNTNLLNNSLPGSESIGEQMIVEWGEDGSASRIGETLSILGRTLGPLNLSLSQLQSFGYK